MNKDYNRIIVIDEHIIIKWIGDVWGETYVEIVDFNNTPMFMYSEHLI